jgi:hypothetical protein
VYIGETIGAKQARALTNGPIRRVLWVPSLGITVFGDEDMQQLNQSALQDLPEFITPDMLTAYFRSPDPPSTDH